MLTAGFLTTIANCIPMAHHPSSPVGLAVTLCDVQSFGANLLSVANGMRDAISKLGVDYTVSACARSCTIFAQADWFRKAPNDPKDSHQFDRIHLCNDVLYFSPMKAPYLLTLFTPLPPIIFPVPALFMNNIYCLKRLTPLQNRHNIAPNIKPLHPHIDPILTKCQKMRVFGADGLVQGQQFDDAGFNRIVAHSIPDGTH
ncbi:hypothetical protein B0O99DRAFT_685504 [Bisporella sp. PMI_857]|nr:hypothetical protein B0O99DRAFT_685504 [Bisporella sp. PMI_857]